VVALEVGVGIEVVDLLVEARQHGVADRLSDGRDDVTA
jgi:hypothetical protein